MHGEHGNAAVQYIDAEIGSVLGYRPSSSLIYFPQFAGLPDDAVIIEKLSDLSDKFCACIAGIIFPPGSGIFLENDAVTEVCKHSHSWGPRRHLHLPTAFWTLKGMSGPSDQSMDPPSVQ